MSTQRRSSAPNGGGGMWLASFTALVVLLCWAAPVHPGPAGRWAAFEVAGETPLPPTADWTADGIESGVSWRGYAVSTAGDVNDDGYADVIVGAPLYPSSNHDDFGQVLVYHGSASGLSAFPDWWVQGPTSLSLWGTNVASAGDVNGDGYDDVIVGVPGNPDGMLPEGAVYVYHGSPTGPSVVPDWVELGPEPDINFAESVGNAGDVDGDGYDEVLVGAWVYSSELLGVGLAMMFSGSSSGLSAEPSWVVEGTQVAELFGFDLDGAGDVDSDGYDDVVVSSTRFDAPGGERSLPCSIDPRSHAPTTSWLVPSRSASSRYPYVRPSGVAQKPPLW